MRPLYEWDADYLDELAGQDETASFEKKAAEGLTPQKIAQGVCAFANSGEGFIAFGFKEEKDGGGLDAGVPATKGRQTVKDWAEALIPKLHQPPIEGCEARLIRHPTHQPDRGVLVVAVPLSERRPHWTRDEEKSYLRVGAHSASMRPQTFLDISSRGPTSKGMILDLGITARPSRMEPGIRDGQSRAFLVSPTVTVESGPLCELWAFELRSITAYCTFDIMHKLPSSAQGAPALVRLSGVHPDISVPTTGVFYLKSKEPLFPKRVSDVLPADASMSLTIPRETQEVGFSARLYLGSAPPVVAQFTYIAEDDRLIAVKR